MLCSRYFFRHLTRYLTPRELKLCRRENHMYISRGARKMRKHATKNSVFPGKRSEIIYLLVSTARSKCHVKPHDVKQSSLPRSLSIYLPKPIITFCRFVMRREALRTSALLQPLVVASRDSIWQQNRMRAHRFFYSYRARDVKFQFA